LKVSSRHLPSRNKRNNLDTDDDDDSGSEDGTFANDSGRIQALAKEFVNEIENLVQKSFDDDDRQEIVLEELKKITSENDNNDADVVVVAVEMLKPESDEAILVANDDEPKTVNGNDQVDDSSNNSKVTDYLAKSQLDKSYQRTFSEVENFNEPSLAVKEKVERYFKESAEKKSFTRGFSEAINYVEPKVDIDQLLKPGTPVSSQTVMCLKKQLQEKEDKKKEEQKAQKVFEKARDALADSDGKEFKVEDYFKESQDRKTYRRDFSEALDQLQPSEQSSNTNPDIQAYFERSAAQGSFQRQFSEAVQDVPPRIQDILVDDKVKEPKNGAPLHYQRSSRASSVSSNCSDDQSVDERTPRKTKKHGKKYGIDKYFATSLYRTAYHRRQSTDADSELKIVEDEDVFGETDLLRQQTFQHDDETPVTQHTNDVNENQTVQFWRDFLKPYNLNLQTDIVTRDELLNNRTLE